MGMEFQVHGSEQRWQAGSDRGQRYDHDRRQWGFVKFLYNKITVGERLQPMQPDHRDGSNRNEQVNDDAAFDKI